MFRNWLVGSRDLYLTISKDKGKTFSMAQKLGQGTWPLKGCPMDGGGLSLNANTIETAWQREGVVYHVRPGQPEQKIGEGRRVGMKGNIVTWENGSDLMVHRLNGQTTAELEKELRCRPLNFPTKPCWQSGKKMAR